MKLGGVVDARLIPLVLYAVFAVCIYADYYGEQALMFAQLTMMVHGVECVQKFSVLRRDAAEGGPPLVMQLAMTMLFG